MKASAILFLAFLFLPALAHAECLLWSQSRCDARNSAAIDLSGNSKESPRTWTFDGSGRVWGYEPGLSTWSSPALAVVDGTPMVVAGSYDHALYALSAATGSLLWRFNTGAPIHSAPVFFRHGSKTLLFAASNDRLVYAVDSSQGSQVWVHEVEPYAPTLGGARLASPCIGGGSSTDDTIYVPYWVWDRSLGKSLQKSAVLALSLSDGKPRFRTLLGDGELTAAIFARLSGKGYLFLGSSSGKLIALSAADGQVVWKKAELDSVRSPPALAETKAGPLLITGSKFGMVRGLDPLTGMERWHFQTGDRVTGSPVALDGVSPNVLVPSYDRSVYALTSEQGRMVWQGRFRAGVYSSPAVVEQGGSSRFLVMAWDHMLHVGDLANGTLEFSSFTGRPLWNVAGMDDSNWSSPAVGRVDGHRMAFVGSYDGAFRGLLLDDQDRAAPAARSNLWFWLSFPLVLGPFALLAVLLTRWDRRLRRPP